MKIVLKENERIDDLGYNGLKIIQNKNKFCFGIDSILLSNFAKEIKKESNVIDIGTGTGILGILLCGKTNLNKVIGIEVQKEMCEMANRSIILNNLQDRFELINEDINNIENILNNCKYDAIVTNPPYKKINSGIENQDESIFISRHEVKCNLEEIIKKSFYLLKNNGSFYMVHRPERLVDILFYLRKYSIEPKKIRFVHSKINSDPKLVLIKGIKCGKPFLKIENPVIIYNENGTYTDEIIKIYNMGVNK